MVSEKMIILVLVIIILLSVIAIVVTLNIDLEKFRTSSAIKEIDSDSGRVELVVENPIRSKNG